MFYNYLVVAFRRLKSDSLFTSVNLIGLSVALLCFIMTLLYMLDELSYDGFWQKSENIYRLETVVKRSDGSGTVEFVRTFGPVKGLVEANLQGQDAITRLKSIQFLAANNENRFYQDVSFADQSFFKVFNFNFLQGNSEQALLTPFTAVLTESAAIRYFGQTDIVDQVLTLDGKHKLQITGVVEDVPKNTHLDIEVIVSIESLSRMYGENMLRNWNFPNVNSYVAIKPKEDHLEWQNQITELVNKNVPTRLQGSIILTLVPISDIYIKGNELGGFNTIYVLGLLSSLVLVMACINTINLATAKGGERDRETGIRKALGGTRAQLFSQFMVESYLLVFSAVVLALLFVDLLLPWFNQVTAKTLSIHALLEPDFLIGLFLLTLVTGFLSGAYPATVMSSYKPVDIFKGSAGYGEGSFSTRFVLLIFQFVVAVAICIGTFFIYKQMDYIKSIDLGFSDENLIVINNIGWTDIRPHYSTLQQELEKHPNIEKVSGSFAVPGKEFDRVGNFHIEGSPAESAVTLNRMSTDFGFFQTYGVELSAGRYFSKDYGSDQVFADPDDKGKATFSAILNETAVKKLGIKSSEEALGERLISSDKKWNFDVRVVGIVKDFHLLAGHGVINPYLFIISPGAAQYASVKIAGGDLVEVVEYIDNTWNRIIPQYPIVRSFLDDDMNKAFAQWERNGQLMMALSFIAICIAATGSFGMAAFSAKNRNLEIGMRKVVGASTFDLIKLLIWDLSKPLLLANFIAWPLIYFVVRNWLNNFAFRIDISMPIFLFVGIGSIIFCWLTVSYHTLRLARTSPANTFKHL